jgi:indole-3-glycerol phosphate synthase
LGLLPLVEVHSKSELSKLKGIAGSFALGINNRNLGSLKVDLNATVSLAPLARELKPVCLVSESGIKTAAQIQRLSALGCTAFLIGETLITAPDPEAKLRQLRGES